jgi:hypothetical protein
VRRYTGAACIGDLVTTVSITDLESPLWFGLVRRTAVLTLRHLEEVDVELLDKGFLGLRAIAVAESDGTLRGSSRFRCGSPPNHVGLLGQERP